MIPTSLKKSNTLYVYLEPSHHLFRRHAHLFLLHILLLYGPLLHLTLHNHRKQGLREMATSTDSGSISSSASSTRLETTDSSSSTTRPTL